MKKYTSKNYGKGFRRCKKFDYYLAQWRASMRKPYRGINAFLEAVLTEDDRKDFAAKLDEWHKKSLVVYGHELAFC